ncbi:MAG: OmpH family outer membrane protein [Syntrophothermus sp.]
MQDENNVTIPGSTGEEFPEQPKKPVFNLHLLLELVLLAGLAVLYILFFTSGKGKKEVTPVVSSAGNAAKTVFVNIDTLNVHYKYVKDLSSDLEATGKKLQGEILSEQSSFEKDAADFQKQVQANAIPEAQAKTKYEALMMRQQALVEKKDRYTQQVADKELKMHQTLLDTVNNFLKRYNRNFGYEYILGYSKQGEILYANDMLDITTDVLKALNEEYDKKK